MSNIVKYNQYNKTTIPFLIDGDIINIDYDYLPKALPPHNEIIKIPVKGVDSDGKCNSIFYKKIEKPKIKIIEISDNISLFECDCKTNDIPDILYIILNTDFETNKEINFDLPQFNIEDLNLSKDIEHKLSVINVDQDSENTTTTTSGPGKDIQWNKQNYNETIAIFLNMVQNKNVRKTIKAKSAIIDGKKAAIELIIRPHKILDRKKLKRKRPKVYALIDTETSKEYGYGDDGKFLNQFAQTCALMGIITWRAKKLTKNYYMEKTPSIGFRGELSHIEWADLIKIKKGSLVLLVGDGCLGTDGDITGDDVWDNKTTKAFAEKYKPMWIHKYDEDTDCGCCPKKITMQSNWDFYYGIKNINSLKQYINKY